MPLLCHTRVNRGFLPTRLLQASLMVSLIAASDGNLYGVAYGGLANNPYGTIFKATLDGRVSLLHKFDLANGAAPYSLMPGRDGNLYVTDFGSNSHAIFSNDGRSLMVMAPRDNVTIPRL